jgi:septum formation protein
MKKNKKTSSLSDPFVPFIILASSSPRRVDLLRQANLPVVIRSPDVDEKVLKGERPQELVKRLARLKADSVVKQVETDFPSGVVISADTIVVAPRSSTILGKPDDHADAVRMLSSLAGRTHTVFTGYCLSGFGFTSERHRKIVRVVKSQVTLRSIDRTMIESYVRTGEPMDKAGAYAAQGIGMSFIEKISGSYTNVVGLPLSQVLADLEGHFGISARF